MQFEQIIVLAQKNGWKPRSNSDPWVLIFDQGGGQINVWYTKMTVGVYLKNTPQSKRKQGVYHKAMNSKKLRKLFENTPKRGYRQLKYKPSNKKFNLPPLHT